MAIPTPNLSTLQFTSLVYCHPVNTHITSSCSYSLKPYEAVSVSLYSTVKVNFISNGFTGFMSNLVTILAGVMRVVVKLTR